MSFPTPVGYEIENTDKMIPGSEPSKHFFRGLAQSWCNDLNDSLRRQKVASFRSVVVQRSHGWRRWQVIALQNVLVMKKKP